MVKRVLVAAGLVAALAGGTAIAVAQPPQDGPRVSGPGRGPRGGMRGGFGGILPLRGIALTDAQREQVRSIMASHKAEFDQVRTKLREGHQALAAASNGQPVDEAAIRAASTSLAAAMASFRDDTAQTIRFGLAARRRLSEEFRPADAGARFADLVVSMT